MFSCPPGLPSSPCPTFDGFVEWIYPITGIPTAVLPVDSPWLVYAYDVALATVNLQLHAAPGPIYMLAVYNLAADQVFNWTPDLPNAPIYKDSLPYFAYWRSTWNLNGFVAGVINSSSDESTSQSMTVPKAFEALTLSDLQNLKTPWGRQYLIFAQKVGTMWGLTR